MPISLSGTGTLTIDGGTLNLAGADTYVGATAIHSGTLLVTNSAGSATGISTVSVGNGASLDGSGNAGGSVSVAAGGTVDPGDGMLTSVLDTGSVSFADGSNFNVTINNSTTNSLSIGYDQLKVTGNISIASLSTGATLNLSGVGNTAAGDQLIIAQCTGTFANATPGTILTVGNESYSVSYTSSEMILTDVTPAAPTLTDLYVSSFSATTMSLAWTNNAPADSEVNILVSTNGTNYSVLQTVSSSPPTYLAADLNPGTQYDFEVEAISNTVLPVPSNVVSATTVATDIPQDLNAVAASPNEVDLSWPAYSAAGATAINIFASTDGTNFGLFDSISGSQTTYQALGLIPATDYTFEVTASDTNHDAFTPSSLAAATTPADPWNTQASGPASIAEGDLYQLNLSAGSPSATPSLGFWTVDWGDGTTATTYSPGTTLVSHTFATSIDSAIINVTASTAEGAALPLKVSAASIPVDMVPTAPLDPQTTVYSPTEIDLAWADVSHDAEGYSVLRSVESGIFDEIANVGAGADSYNETTLSPGESAEYEIEADGDTPANNSAPVLATPAPAPDVTTPLTAPPAGQPTLAAAANPDGTNSVVLTWTYAGTDDTGFEIEMKDLTLGQNFSTIATPGPVDAAGIGTMTVANITIGDAYQFRIRADHVGLTASRYTKVPFTLSGPDVSVSATPGHEYEDYFVTVSWNPSAAVAASGGGIAGYNVQWRGSSYVGTGWTGLVIYPGQGTTVQDDEVGRGQTAQFRVQAIYNNGGTSDWGYSSIVAEGDDYGAPPSVSAHVASNTEVDLTISDDAPQAVNYSSIYYLIAYAPITAAADFGDGVYLPESQRVMRPGASETIAVTGLQAGVLYDFEVCASWHQMGFNGDPFDESGFGITHEYVSTTGATDITPAPPVGLRPADLGDGVSKARIELNWYNSSDNEDGFIIQRSTDPQFVRNVSEFRVNADQTSFVDSFTYFRSVVAAKNISPLPIYYRVAAFRGNAQSTWVSTKITPSSDPEALAVSWLSLLPAGVDVSSTEEDALDFTSNEPPPGYFFLGTGQAFGGQKEWSLESYELFKDFRNILSVQVGYTVDQYSGQFSSINPIVKETPGFTPFPNVYLQGQTGAPEQSIVVAPDRKGAAVTVLVRFRLHAAENVGFAVTEADRFRLPHRAPWAWAKITYFINTDGYYAAYFSGSAVPSQSDYLNEDATNSYLMTTNPGGINAFLKTPYGQLGPVDSRNGN